MANEKLKDPEVERFYKGLSDAEWADAEAIEAEIGRLLTEGLSEATGPRFVRAVMEIRKVTPAATVEGVFEVVLKAGLTYLEAVHIKAAGGSIKQKNRRGKLAGAGV
jgi:hypothetical protein